MELEEKELIVAEKLLLEAEIEEGRDYVVVDRSIVCMCDEKQNSVGLSNKSSDILSYCANLSLHF